MRREHILLASTLQEVGEFRFEKRWNQVSAERSIAPKVRRVKEKNTAWLEHATHFQQQRLWVFHVFHDYVRRYKIKRTILERQSLDISLNLVRDASVFLQTGKIVVDPKYALAPRGEKRLCLIAIAQPFRKKLMATSEIQPFNFRPHIGSEHLPVPILGVSQIRGKNSLYSRIILVKGTSHRFGKSQSKFILVPSSMTASAPSHTLLRALALKCSSLSRTFSLRPKFAL
jgi:hypothetical protein